MNEPKPITQDQAFQILSAAHVELTIENRLLRASLMQAEARIKELTPPPEGEKKTLEAVK